MKARAIALKFGCYLFVGLSLATLQEKPNLSSVKFAGIFVAAALKL